MEEWFNKAPDFKSGDPKFDSCSDHHAAKFLPGSPWFDSSAVLLH